MIEIKKIKPWSLAKVLMLFFFIYSLLSLIVVLIFYRDTDMTVIVWSAIVTPLLSIVAGLFSGLVTALVYNLIAKIFGGIVFEERTIAVTAKTVEIKKEKQEVSSKQGNKQGK